MLATKNPFFSAKSWISNNNNPGSHIIKFYLFLYQKSIYVNYWLKFAINYFFLSYSWVQKETRHSLISKNCFFEWFLRLFLLISIFSDYLQLSFNLPYLIIHIIYSNCKNLRFYFIRPSLITYWFQYSINLSNSCKFQAVNIFLLQIKYSFSFFVWFIFISNLQ